MGVCCQSPVRMTPGCKAKASTFVPSVLQKAYDRSCNCIVVISMMQGRYFRLALVIPGIKADAEQPYQQQLEQQPLHFDSANLENPCVGNIAAVHVTRHVWVQWTQCIYSMAANNRAAPRTIIFSLVDFQKNVLLQTLSLVM